MPNDVWNARSASDDVVGCGPTDGELVSVPQQTKSSGLFLGPGGYVTKR